MELSDRALRRAQPMSTVEKVTVGAILAMALAIAVISCLIALAR